VVVVYFEGGEHGPLAARIASQVIKVFVDKQRRLRNNPMLFSDKADPGSVPIAGVWNKPEGSDEHPDDSDDAAEHIQGGTFLVKMGSGRSRSSRSAQLPPTIAFGRAGED
jgi:hypothetical protein